MTGILAPPATLVPDILAREADDAGIHRDGEALQPWIGHLMKHRGAFGITRIGALTRLDRIGIPVVQVTRPLALSNAVSQGKGLDILSAAASGWMEALETWAAERIPTSQVRLSTASCLGANIVDLYAPWTRADNGFDWISAERPWLDGWDLLSGTLKPVPLALVDTAYTVPPPHPPLFPRVTTGLGAGATLTAAIIQAGLEILERDALIRTYRTPYFFERFQIDPSTIRAGLAASVLRQIETAGYLAGAWRAPAAHELPVYRCHVMEAEDVPELAPLPAEGSACGFTHDGALAGALLEACQARLAAIAGAREDITRRMYPSAYDRPHLAAWRSGLRATGTLAFSPDGAAAPEPGRRLRRLLDSCRRAGARAVIVVPLFRDGRLGVHVVRMVAPPLRLWPGDHHG